MALRAASEDVPSASHEEEHAVGEELEEVEEVVPEPLAEREPCCDADGVTDTVADGDGVFAVQIDAPGEEW